MKPPNIVTVHFLSTKWSKKLFTINHYELQNGKCIVTQELSAYQEKLDQQFFVKFIRKLSTVYNLTMDKYMKKYKSVELCRQIKGANTYNT